MSKGVAIVLCPACNNAFGKRAFGGFCSDACQAEGMCREMDHAGRFCGRVPSHEGGHRSVEDLRRLFSASPAVTTSSTIDVRAVRALVDLATELAEQMEARKHGDQPELLEVKTLAAASAVDALLRKVGA